MPDDHSIVEGETIEIDLALIFSNRDQSLPVNLTIRLYDSLAVSPAGDGAERIVLESSILIERL